MGGTETDPFCTNEFSVVVSAIRIHHYSMNDTKQKYQIPKLEKNLALKFRVKQTTRNYLRILRGILELVKAEMQYRSRSIPLIFTGVSSSSIISPLTTCPR